MSFRDNLPYLRSLRDMTQDQLATLLGVTSQSIIAWETGAASPDVDMLLALSNLFGCTVDELVRADLTGAAGAPKLPSSPDGAQDVCGYDRHSRMFARRISLGVAALLLGIVLPTMLDDSVSERIFQRPDVASVVIALAGLVVSLVIIVPTAHANGTFIEAHPHIGNFYTQEDRTRANTLFMRGAVTSLVVSVAGYVVFCVILARTPLVHCFLLCVAGGVTLFTYATLMRLRVNIDGYNKISTR